MTLQQQLLKSVTMKLRNGKLIIPKTPELRCNSKTIRQVVQLVECILNDSEDPSVVAFNMSKLCTLLLGNWDTYLKIKRLPNLQRMIVRLIKIYRTNPFYEHFYERFDSILTIYWPAEAEQQRVEWVGKLRESIDQNQRNQQITEKPSLYCAERRPSRFFSTLFMILLLLILIGQAGYSYQMVLQQKNTLGFRINDPV